MSLSQQVELSPTLVAEGRRVQEAVRKLSQSWPSALQLTRERSETVRIYDCYPHLFREAFPSIDDGALFELAVGCRLLASWNLALDRTVDTGRLDGTGTNLFLTSQAMRFESEHILHRLIPSEAPFWSRLRTWQAELFTACQCERNFAEGRAPWSGYTEAVGLSIIAGKNAMARTVAAGLVELGEDRDDLLEPVIDAIDAFSRGFQFLDDLQDFRDDLRARLPSLLLVRVAPSGPPDTDDDDGLDRWIEGAAREVYYGGHAEHALEQAIRSFDRSLVALEGLPAPAWNDFIGGMRDQTGVLLSDISKIVTTNRQRVARQPRIELNLPAPTAPWEAIAFQALERVVAEWHRGFGEMRDIMALAPDERCDIAEPFQFGDVFQRALVADILCHANRRLGHALDRVLDYECDYLVGRRRTEGVGGWSYFPDMPQMPSDADDLAQVMQVLIGCGRAGEVPELCEKPLRVVLEDNRLDDGGFDTWIIPSEGRTSIEELQAKFVRTPHWAGSDPEVVANLLFALALYDERRFAAEIRRGIAYLESAQREDGSWESTWYHGPYYGTYVVLRLLAARDSGSAALPAAMEFLRNSQRADGGWGLDEEKSDALSTSLALLALGAGHRGGAGEAKDIERSTRALDLLQRGMDGLEGDGWSSVPFIRIVAPGPSECYRVTSYESRTMTAAYVLRAGLEWSELEGLASEADRLEVASA